MKIENLNSQASLEQLASYIMKAANQSEIIDDTTTVTDSCWSSNKVKEELDSAKETADEDYVATDQGTSQSGRFLSVGSDGKVTTSPMQFEDSNIDFANDF